jgi:hypothetical protein
MARNTTAGSTIPSPSRSPAKSGSSRPSAASARAAQSAVAPVDPQRGKAIGLGQPRHRCRLHPGPPPDLFDRAIAVAARRRDPVGLFLGDAADLA